MANHMKRISILLCAVLLLALLVPTSALAKAEGMLSADLDGFFGWVYCTNNIPQGASLRDQTLQISSMYHAAGQPEGLISCAVEFVRGDEHLRDAVKVACTRSNSINYSTLAELTTVTAEISIDNSLLSEPGTAVFAFTFETEHYALRKTETLRVLAEDDMPTVTELFEDPVFFMKPGNSFTTGDATRALLTTDMLSFCAANSLPAPIYGANIERPEGQEGLDYLEAADLFSVKDYGVFPLTMHFYIANAQWEIPFRVQSKSYTIRGASWIMPGETEKYRILDEDAAASRKFTFSVTGNEAVIDPQSGDLTVSESATPGNPLTIAVTPEGDEPYSMTVRVVDGQLGKTPEMEAEPELENGFRVPVPSGWNTTTSKTRDNGWIYQSYGRGDNGSTLVLEVRTDSLGNTFVEHDADALSYYDTITFNANARDLQQEDIVIWGHYARLFTYTTRNQNNQLIRVGEIVYARNNAVLTINLYAMMDGTDETTLAPVTMADLKRLAFRLRYDESQAVIRQKDTELTISAKEDTCLLSAGRNLQFTAAFANPDAINGMQRNNGVVWAVVDPATGEPSPWTTVTREGSVSVLNTLESETEVEVRATSETYGTQASYLLTLLPASQRVSIEPSEAYYYRGTETEITLQALIQPETIPLKGLTWSTSLPESSELIPGEGGTAIVRYLAEPRDMDVTVRDPSGRTGKATIYVVNPVEEVSFTVRGKAIPGRTLTCKPAFTPKRGIETRVEWSVDVGEDIAVIGNDGALTISESAQPGTVITVTCKALGAPEPVIAQEEILVEAE